MGRSLPALVLFALLAGCASDPVSDAASTTSSAVPSSTAQSSTVAPSPASPPSRSDGVTVTQAPVDSTAPPSSEAPPSTTVPTTTRAVDTAPPALVVTDPVAGGIVTERAYRFRGNTEPGATMTAAGRYAVDVSADGSWSIVLILNPGSNVATFIARDGAGNTTELRHRVLLHECADDPAASIPDVADVSSVSGDIDGDGETDTVSVYQAGESWFLAAELAYGWSTALDITAQTSEWIDPASVHRIVDVGDPVIVVIHGGTLVGNTAGPYGFRDCELTPLPDIDRGEVLQLFESVSIGGPQRYVCEDDGFVQASLQRRERDLGGFVLDRYRAIYVPDAPGFEVWASPPEIIGDGIPDTDPEFDRLWSETLAMFPQC